VNWGFANAHINVIVLCWHKVGSFIDIWDKKSALGCIHAVAVASALLCYESEQRTIL